MTDTDTKLRSALPEDLFDRGITPIFYQYATKIIKGRSSVYKFAESYHYRTQGYRCFRFYKPISRCVPALRASTRTDEHG